MAEQRIDLVTLGVTDVERSRRFYVEGMGWEPVLVLDEVVFLSAGHGLLLGLYGAAALGEDAGVPIASGGHAPFSLADNVGSEADVDGAIDRARAAGATVVKEPQPAFWGGYHAYFTDPDGFLWEVAHNPGLTVAEDGTVTIAEVE